MPAKKSFYQLIRERSEILWAPCVFDCFSAKCAESIGFEALTISSTEQKHSFVGQPIMSMDEIILSASNIIRSTNCAVLVDGEDGGGKPMAVYRNVKRLAEAGAMAVSIEDQFMDATMGVRTIGVTQPGRKAAIHDPIIPAEIWAANVQAAVEACRGTECMVIARVQHKSTVGGAGPQKFAEKAGYDLDEAIRRAQLGVKMGADMTMIQNICYRGGRPEWEEIHKRVPGWFCYPDIHADGGVSDVDDLDELYQLGFKLLTCHCFMKGAWKGMLEYGRRVFEDKNTIFTENDDFGYPIWQLSPCTFPEWAQACDHWVGTMEQAKDFKEE